MTEWHMIDGDAESYLWMREIDGGWLYKTVDYDIREPQRFAVAMIFVPNTEQDTE
jgi:hypothetical protein